MRAVYEGGTGSEGMGHRTNTQCPCMGRKSKLVEHVDATACSPLYQTATSLSDHARFHACYGLQLVEQERQLF
jgi:hypothetical protein